MAEKYSHSEVKQLTEFALAVNEALLRNETADFVAAGGSMAVAAFRQHIFECYQFSSITPYDWFNDDVVRGEWAQQIASVKESYDKATADQPATEAAQDATAELAELKTQFAALEAKVDAKEDETDEEDESEDAETDEEDKPADEDGKPETE